MRILRFTFLPLLAMAASISTSMAAAPAPVIPTLIGTFCFELSSTFIPGGPNPAPPFPLWHLKLDATQTTFGHMQLNGTSQQAPFGAQGGPVFSASGSAVINPNAPEINLTVNITQTSAPGAFNFGETDTFGISIPLSLQPGSYADNIMINDLTVNPPLQIVDVDSGNATIIPCTGIGI